MKYIAKLILLVVVMTLNSAVAQLVVRDPSEQQLMRVHDNGNIVLGADQDDPGEKLRVMGNVSGKPGAHTTGNLNHAGFVFDQNTDTGLFHPEADKLALAFDGLGLLNVTPDGKVGIGTESPMTDLTVRDASAFTSHTGTRMAYRVLRPADPAIVLGTNFTNNTHVVLDSTDGFSIPTDGQNDGRYLRFKTTNDGSVHDQGLLINQGAVIVDGESTAGQAGDLIVENGTVRIQDLAGTTNRFLTADENGRLGTAAISSKVTVLNYCDLEYDYYWSTSTYTLPVYNGLDTVIEWNWLDRWTCGYDPENTFYLNGSDGYFQVPYDGLYRIWLYAQFQNHWLPGQMGGMPRKFHLSYYTRIYWGSDVNNLTEYNETNQGEFGMNPPPEGDPTMVGFGGVSMMQPQNAVMLKLDAGDYIRIRTGTNHPLPPDDTDPWQWSLDFGVRPTNFSIVYMGNSN